MSEEVKENQEAPEGETPQGVDSVEAPENEEVEVQEETTEEAAVATDAPADDVPSSGQDDSSAPDAEEEETPTADDRYHWYVVHTYSGHEDKVCQNIERAVEQAGLGDRVPRVLIPTENVAEMKNGKKSIQTKKFFPSYVLVQMDMDDESWQVVSNTPGVTRFVGIGAKPHPLSEEEIGRILGRIEGTKGKPTPSVPYHVGEHVKVVDGPFTDFTGVVEEVNAERGKLKVMVTIFGRATPVELDFLQVKNL